MDLHPGEQVVFEGRPVWRSILSFYISGLIGAIIIGVIIALVASTGLGVAVFLVLFAAVVLVGFIKRITTRYTITNQRLRIERGLLSKHVQQTRIERVQNVNTNQTFVSRVLRVGTVDFDTAGTDDSDFTFIGVGSPHEVVDAVDRAQREATAAGHTRPDGL
ncbi:MAG TPA: PH domain-containing protein [Solirubrobacteraceae bacterium]|nr:PH domain-containing protein [Solirubrobacteraceae bacterium]